MLKPGTLLGDIKGELGGLAKDTLKSVVKEPKDLAKKAAQQIGLEHEPGAAEKSSEAKTELSQVANKELLEAMYGSSKKNTEESVHQDKNLEGEQANPIVQKDQEHQQVHTETYYRPLIEKAKQLGTTQEDIETKVERVERLEMEDLQEKKKKEEKKKPISVDRAERSIEGATKDAAG